MYDILNNNLILFLSFATTNGLTLLTIFADECHILKAQYVKIKNSFTQLVYDLLVNPAKESKITGGTGKRVSFDLIKKNLVLQAVFMT
jgi:hypothetical protein